MRAALQVTSVTDGSGAIINGTIEPGDIISEVDDVLPSCANDILFGAKDSVIKLTVVSASGSDFECTVMRNMPVRVWQRWHRKEVLCACRLNRVPCLSTALARASKCGGKADCGVDAAQCSSAFP
jgi:hypothetical protein